MPCDLRSSFRPPSFRRSFCPFPCSRTAGRIRNRRPPHMRKVFFRSTLRAKRSSSTQTNFAVRFSSGTSAISESSFSLFFVSSQFSPAYLAEYIPGAPERKSTQSPESSPTPIYPSSAAALAFISAFSSNVFPSSTISPVKPTSRSVRTSTSWPSKRAASSFAL